MKARGLILSAIVAIAAGVALIIANNSIKSTGVVVAGGILFILAGLLNVFVFYSERKSKDYGAFASTFNILANIGALVLGICMLIFQDTFVKLVPYMFGIIVAFLSAYQFFVLAIGARPAVLPAWFYVVPVILAGAAIYLFVDKNVASDDHIIMLVTGIALAFFGLFGIIEGSMMPHLRKKEEEGKAALEQAKATAPEPKPLDSQENGAKEPAESNKGDE